MKYGQKGSTHNLRQKTNWVHFHHLLFITAAIVQCIRNKHVFGHSMKNDIIE